jgi:phospholipid/cholesterol/gamma-HCH transport system substrate-binding protein
MNKPFKFRYVREIVGSFMLLMILLLVGGVILAGRAQGWFEPTLELRVHMPDEGLAGIHKGSPVMTLGTQVGVVDDVHVNDDESLEVILSLKGDFIRFVRSDSVASIKKQFGVAGDSLIELSRGVGAEIEGDYLPLPAQKNREIVELVEELVVQVQWAVMPLLEQVRAAAEQYTDLGIDLQKSAISLQSLLAGLNDVATGLNEGEGTAGRLLKDASTVEELNTLLQSANLVLTNLSAVVGDVKSVVTNVNLMVEDTQGVVKNIKRASTGVPAMMNQTESTLDDVQLLLEGLQRHWLLRKYIETPDVPTRILPSSAVPLNADRLEER